MHTVNILPAVATAPPIDVTHFIGNRDGISYDIAHMIMTVVDWLLGIFGLSHETIPVTILYAAVVLGLALVVGYVVKTVTLWTVHAVARRWNSDLYKAMLGQFFIHKLLRVIPPLVFLILIQFTLSNHNSLSTILTKITCIYIVFVMAVALSALIMALWQHINASANKRHLPLSGLAQLAKGIVWIIAVIVMVAILLDKSPASLLAGLGAFAAVLMLIFKDSILGVVAGVQLAENDSLHVGDWIKVDGTDANGTVAEVSLVAVKVINWDKTTTTLPPYSLISTGFTNYRSMQRSNTRRVCRSYMIDADSVMPATDELLQSLRSLPFMDRYITVKLQQQKEGKVADVDNPAGLVNGTIDTNLGLFRAYIKMWLDANPNVAHDSDCFVSTLPQTASGIPFQVYCFTSTSAWFAYEAIQDSIFEHVAASLRFFGLYTFENPSGRDTVIDGYLSPGKDINALFSIPEPFFKSNAKPNGGAPTTQAQAPAAAQTAAQPQAPAAESRPDGPSAADNKDTAPS